jgi:soluble lytic murein transglycosylase-like protein
VKIAWPSDADRATNSVLHWRKDIPWRVRRWAYLIVPAARSAGLDPFLVAAVVRAESSGDPLAWQLDSDAHGLMQVLHAPFQPAANIRIGTSMLAGFIRQFRSRDLGLAAYNAGPGAVQQYGGVPPYVETRSYVLLVDYWRDQFAGVPISPTRTARFNAAVRAVEAYYRRLCGHTSGR